MNCSYRITKKEFWTSKRDPKLQGDYKEGDYQLFWFNLSPPIVPKRKKEKEKKQLKSTKVVNALDPTYPLSSLNLVACATHLHTFYKEKLDSHLSSDYFFCKWKNTDLSTVLPHAFRKVGCEELHRRSHLVIIRRIENKCPWIKGFLYKCLHLFNYNSLFFYFRIEVSNKFYFITTVYD